MGDAVTGELSCQVHLSATVRSLMRDGGAILMVREIVQNIEPVKYHCTCRLPAEFHIVNVGRIDADDPFPLFREI